MHPVAFFNNSPDTIWREKPDADHAVVFIHGIFSDHHTFNTMAKTFTIEFPQWEIGYSDYNYYEKMEINASTLCDILVYRYEERYKENDNFKLTLICHSMGGVIARLAVIQFGKKLPFLHRIILLGTPNFGAVRTAQMGILAQMMFGSVKMVGGIFTRKTGVVDLTRVETIVNKALIDSEDEFVKAEATEYVSSAGRFYNKDRSMFRTTGDLTSTLTGLPKLFFELVNLGVPGMNFRLTPDHDGIVEADSVNMAAKQDRLSEKRLWIFDKDHKIEPNHPTYLHAEPNFINYNLTHTTIQSDEHVIKMVICIMQYPSLKTWYDSANKKKYMLLPADI